jgi:hypothetical protein
MCDEWTIFFPLVQWKSGKRKGLCSRATICEQSLSSSCEPYQLTNPYTKTNIPFHPSHTES